jgi:hypothetical protein
VGYLINAYSWLALRPLLAGAPRTTERITLSELLGARAAIMPLLFAVSCAFSTYAALTSAWGISTPIDSFTLAALSGWLALYFFAMLRAKRKMTSGPWS